MRNVRGSAVAGMRSARTGNRVNMWCFFAGASPQKKHHIFPPTTGFPKDPAINKPCIFEPFGTWLRY
jgi:hypothetical protein